MGGFELIYPLPDKPENEEKIKQYDKFLQSATDYFDFFNSGKRKYGTRDPNVVYNKRFVDNDKN